jgi:hypothetical protein
LSQKNSKDASPSLILICNLRFDMPKAWPWQRAAGSRKIGPAVSDPGIDVITEADTCRKYVLPRLYAAGWNDDQISEQKSFTDGRILVVGAKARRRPAKRADYLLRYARDFTLAVIEAKAAYRLPGDGLQQAKDYAAILV